MGWYFNMGGTMADVIRERIAPQRWTNEAGVEVTHETVKHCLVGPNLWTVLEVKRDGVLEYRTVVLYLLQKAGRGMGAGYKDIPECMGPCEVNCPLSYLDGLTEPDSYAAEWRERCRAYHAEQARKRAYLKSLELGSEVLVGKVWYTLTGKTVPGYRGQYQLNHFYRVRPSQITIPTPDETIPA